MSAWDLRPISLSLLCALPLACFDGEASEDNGGETAGDGDGDTVGDGDGEPTGDGDGEPTGDGDGEPTGDGDGEPADNPPQFVSFTVNGSTSPGLVTSASGVLIEAEIGDLDMDVNYVVFKRDGEIVATFANDPGPSYAFEWLVSGTEFNATYELTAEATDSNDNMAVSDPVSLSVGMAEGGTEVEQWTHDSGNLDAAYDILVDADGTAVVITGQTTQNMASRQRTDRIVGAAWTDKIEDVSAFGAAVTMRADGGYFVAGAIPKPNNKLDSALYHYDAGGTKLGETLFDGSSQPAMVDDIDNPIAMERAPGGVLVMGAYFASGGPIQNNWGTYVRRYTDAMDLEWSRWPSETLPGRPFAYDFAANSDGAYVLVGGQFSVMPIKPWFGLFDPAGDFVGVVEIDDFSGGILHAVDLADDNSLVFGGQATIAGEGRSWVRSIDPGGNQLWEADIPGSGLGVVAALAIDPFGEIVSVATEGCALVGVRYEACDLAIRKHDPSGALMWEQVYAGGDFLGPNLALLGFDAAIDVDRFGYVYVSAIVYDAQGTDWWARKLNP